MTRRMLYGMIEMTKSLRKEAIKMDRFHKRKEEILKDASELIQIKSVTCDREKNKEALQWVIGKAEAFGLRADIAVPGEAAVITLGFGRWESLEELQELVSKSTKETLGILVHVDVVPAEGIWTNAPFSGEVKDGFIWGRGIQDDKGPLVLCLHAMAELAATCRESELKRNILMVAGSREEEAWLDIDTFNKMGIKPDYGFTPDGEFPVTNREKGYLDVAFRFRRSEQDRRYLLSGGSASNVIPEMAQLIIKEDDGEPEKALRFYGTATHSSKPENGDNAIVKMADGLQGEELSETVKRAVRFIKEQCRDYYGSGLGLDSGEVVVKGEEFHRNVISPTMLRTSDDYYEIILNIRSTWGYCESKVMKELKKAVAGQDIEIEVLESMDPIMVSRVSELLKTMEKVYKATAGREFDFLLAHGTSYAKAMTNIVAFGPIFPGESDTCHETDERMDVDQFMLAGDIYWNVIKEMCS